MSIEPEDDDEDQDFSPDALNHFPLPGFLNRPSPSPPSPPEKPVAPGPVSRPVQPERPAASPPSPLPSISSASARPASVPPASFPRPVGTAKPAAAPPGLGGMSKLPPAKEPAPSQAAPPDPASFDPPASTKTMADVLRRIQPGQPGPAAQAGAIEALRILTSSTTDLRMPEGNGPDNRLREAMISSDSLIRAIGNYGTGMRLLLLADRKLSARASEHLLTVAGLAGELSIPPDLRNQLLAVIQLTLGLIQGEESSIEYFKPGLQAPDRGTRAAANYNIANRYYDSQPMLAVKHYVETLRLTANPFTRERATQWLKDLGYDTQGRQLS